MRYWFEVCPVCKEGRLFVRKSPGDGALFLLCEECFCRYSHPAETSDPEKAQEGMESTGEFASNADIASGGWAQYSMSVTNDE